MKALAELFRRKIDGYPKGFFVLLYTEICELFGRFGITALLVLYATKTLGISDHLAFAIYSGFFALTYATPLLGGYIADRYLSLKHSIIVGAAIMALGDALMVIPHLSMVYLGLSIVAVGSGLFTPSLAACLGRLYDHHDEGRDGAFVLYYVSKNIGALLAPLLCGAVAHAFGYNFAFVLSTVGMLSGLFVFFRYGKTFASEPINRENRNSKSPQFLKTLNQHLSQSRFSLGVLLLVVTVFVIYVLMNHLDGYMLLVAGAIAVSIIVSQMMRGDGQTRRNLGFIAAATLLSLVFSALLGQGGTTLTLFIERIINRQTMGITIPASFFYSLDPIFMILLGPLVVALVKRIRKPNYESAALMKFALGMILFGIGFSVFIAASHIAISNGHASPLFIILAYAIFPVAELCVMPIAISMVTRLAPKGSESMMVGIYMLGLSGASFFTGKISQLGQINFPLKELSQLQHAAHIYQHLFIISAGILFSTAAVILGARVFVRNYKAKAFEDGGVVEGPVDPAALLVDNS